MGTAKVRRRVYLAFIVLWLTAGTVCTWQFSHSVVWVNIQSWLAMLFALTGSFSAETPVEPES